MEKIYKDIENKYKKPNEWQNTFGFDQNQQQIKFKILNDKIYESKKENEGKVKSLKLQLEIESFLDTLKNSNWLIDFDSMEQIWHWGTHNVFDPNKSGNFIVKINKTVYNESIKGNKNWALNENSKKMANIFITDRNNKFEDLYKSFWIENCLYETIKLVKIKYQNQIVECPIVIQEKSNLYWKDHISFPATYIQGIDSKDSNSYNNLNNVLLTNRWRKKISQTTDAFMFNSNSELKTFIENIKNDKNLQNKVKEFLDKIKNHYENTWEIIDLVGKDNIMFYKEWENRNFKIWSVIKNTSKEDVNNTLNLLKNNPEKFKENTQELNHLNNILAYTRTLNYLWIKLGKNRIINLNLNKKQIKNLNILWK